ncbi:uncharacterized protein [Procambarus clarkii]|uniref:uncharacterized protein isoform X2 n=1 Tax=Procambarus clarkii TaxID=6728 RepID=UPI001E672D43|nr:uncharacterized protein LOC123769290 isoform X2 [Procambarus clarkii]
MAGSEPPRRLSDNDPHVAKMNVWNEERPDYKILLYIPNIIGYIRLFFLLIAFCYLPISPATFVVHYSISIALDGFDGYAARKLRQCSLFGAWMLYMVSAVEWASFVCNHSLGADWQHSLTRHKEKRIISSIVACTLAKNFRNPLGVWAIAGLHVLPVWIFGYQYDLFGSHLWFLPKFVEPFGMVILGMGRLLCFFIEMWSIWVHISSLLVNTSAAL